MTRHFYWGLGILVLFLGLGLFVSFGLARVHEPVSESFSHAAREALDGNLSEGISLAQQAESRWQRYQKVTASVADHTPMDEIERLIAEMEVFAQAGDAKHFAACCAQLARMVKSVADAHSPGWENIL